MAHSQSPVILEQRARPGRVEYALDIPTDLVFFCGHFPAHPILPGVVQIKWVLELAGSLRPAGAFAKLERLKFTRPILPAARLSLHIGALRDRPGLRFCYFDERSRYSAGHIVFAE